MNAVDSMIETATEILLKDNVSDQNNLVFTLANSWPSSPALSICFAITNAGSNLENFSDGNHEASLKAFRLSSILAADIFAIEAMGQVPVCGYHLIHFWRRTDPGFLSSN